MSREPTTPGYSLQRRVAAPPPDVFACLVEAEGFAAWFVVPGFTTPPDRIKIDPRPGGQVAAVLVPDGGGDEVPFTLRYLHLDTDRAVRLEVGESETVALDLVPIADGTALTYTYLGAETAAAGVAAAETMLDHLVRHVER